MAKFALFVGVVVMCLVSLTASATYYLSANPQATKEDVLQFTPSPTTASSPVSTPQLTPTTTPNQMTHNSSPSIFPPIDPSTVVSPWTWSGSNFDSDDPAVMQVVAPQNGSVISQSNVTLQVNLGIQDGIVYGLEYTADWLTGNVTVFLHLQTYNGKLYLMSPALTVSTTISDLPLGNHTLNVYGLFAKIKDSSGTNSIDLKETVNFTVIAPLQP